MKNYNVPIIHAPLHCPACQAKLDALSPVDDTETDDNATMLSVCFNCASFLEISPDYKATVMTLEAIALLPDNVRILLVRVREQLKLRKEK